MSTAAKKPEKQSDTGVKEMAERLKVEAKDLRKWLRSQELGVGRGGKRYSFSAAEATKLEAAYKAAQK